MNKFIISLNTKDVSKYEKIDSIETFIVGDNTFGLRMPINFSIDEIKKLKESTNKKVYVAVNKIFHENELEELEKYLLNIKDIGIDGIIFSDFAVYTILKEINFDIELLYSTDTTITSSSFTNLAKIFNINNVELAKELSLNEIKLINEKKESDITIFIHGHIYMYNSFRRLLTSYFDNFGKELINKEYLLYDDERNAYYPIIENEKGTNILSSYDQNSIRELYDIFSLGIENLKLDSFGYKEEDFLFVINIYDELLKLYNLGIEKDEFLIDANNKLDLLKEKITYKKFNNGFLKKETIF